MCWEGRTRRWRGLEGQSGQRRAKASVSESQGLDRHKSARIGPALLHFCSILARPHHGLSPGRLQKPPHGSPGSLQRVLFSNSILENAGCVLRLRHVSLLSSQDCGRSPAAHGQWLSEQMVICQTRGSQPFPAVHPL